MTGSPTQTLRHHRARTVRAAVVLAVIALCAGCSTELASHPSTTTSPRLSNARISEAPSGTATATETSLSLPGDSSGADDEPPVIPTVPLDGSVPAKAGRDYQVVKVVEPIGERGMTRASLAFGRNGDVLAHESVMGTDERLNPETIKLVRPNEEAIALSKAVPSRQSVYGDLVGDAAVWWSTSSTNIGMDEWQIWGSRHGRMGRLLADSTKLPPGQLPQPRGSVPLTTDGTMAYWEAPRFLGDQPVEDLTTARAVSDIMTTPVDGSGKPRVIAKGAKLPQPTRRGLFYVRSNDVAPDVTTVGGEIHRRDHNGRDEVVVSVSLTQGNRISDMCASEGRLAWAVDNVDRSELYVRDETGHTERRVLNNNRGGISLACGDHFVAWGGGSGSGDMTQYVWAGPGKPILRLDNSPGLAWVDAEGDLFGWWHHTDTDPRTSALTIARLR